MRAVCPIYVNVAIETHEALDYLCHQERVSKSEVVREAIKRELRRRKRVSREGVCKALK